MTDVTNGAGDDSASCAVPVYVIDRGETEVGCTTGLTEVAGPGLGV